MVFSLPSGIRRIGTIGSGGVRQIGTIAKGVASTAQKAINAVDTPEAQDFAKSIGAGSYLEKAKGLARNIPRAVNYGNALAGVKY